MAFCTKCGASMEDSARFCPKCGSAAETDPPAGQSQPIPEQIPAPQPEPAPPVKPKKKHRLPWILRFLIANVIIAAVLLLLWFSVGNTVTLYIHSEDVVEIMNSGSLDLPGAENPYAELPNYIKDMLDNDELTKQNGPVTEAVLPYISVERKAIHGFFTQSSVEYTITAPDLEKWLLNLPVEEAASTDTMLASLKEYLPGAPTRTATVEVQYYRSGFFAIDWQGNYYTAEFADAVCGGLNTAYNKIYEEAMKEMEELFK